MGDTYYLLMHVIAPVGEERVALAVIDKENIQYLLGRLTLIDLLRTEYGIHQFSALAEQDRGRTPKVNTVEPWSSNSRQWLRKLKPDAALVVSDLVLVLEKAAIPMNELRVNFDKPTPSAVTAGRWVFSTQRYYSFKDTLDPTTYSSITYFHRRDQTGTSSLTAEDLQKVLEVVQ